MSGTFSGGPRVEKILIFSSGLISFSGLPPEQPDETSATGTGSLGTARKRKLTDQLRKQAAFELVTVSSNFVSSSSMCRHNKLECWSLVGVYDCVEGQVPSHIGCCIWVGHDFGTKYKTKLERFGKDELSSLLLQIASDREPSLNFCEQGLKDLVRANTLYLTCVEDQ